MCKMRLKWPCHHKWCCEGRTTEIDLPNSDAGIYNHEINFEADLQSTLDPYTIKIVRLRALVAEQHLRGAGQVHEGPWWRRRSNRL